MKKYKKFYVNIILTHIFFIVVFVCFYLYGYKYILSNNKHLDNSIKNLTNNYNIQNNELINIKRNILHIEENVKNNSYTINDIKANNNYDNDISLIKAKIDNIVNTKPEEEKLKHTIIKTLNTILKKYYNNQDFTHEIENLKILCKNNSVFLDNINKLENYKNINSESILDIFDTESKILIIDNESSIFKNLIKVKKISDKKTIKSTNLIVKKIRTNIINNELETAIKLIIENNYQEKLTKTLNALEKNQEFLIFLSSIVENI